MTSQPATLLVEGAFSDLLDEFTQYVDALRKTKEAGSLHQELQPAVEALRQQELAGAEESAELAAQKEACLEKVVEASSALNGAPEKELVSAYNLLIALVAASSDPSKHQAYISQLCANLSQPLTAAAPQHAPAIALTVLSTIFNTLPRTDSKRYPVFLAVLAVVRAAHAGQAFQGLKAQLAAQLPAWVAEWALSPADTQKLHLAIADVAREVPGERELAHSHVLLALQAVPPADAAAPASRAIALRALVSALTLPSVFDFVPLTDSDAVQALRATDPALFDLLEIFAADTLDTYEEYIASTPLSSIQVRIAGEKEGEEATVDLAAHAATLQTKMRLLTLASLAASTPSRSLSYAAIAAALRIEPADVESWVIDAIRAGLVEGKLSQLRGEFLVQRTTYRVFGEKQWAEVQGRLMVWRQGLENVLHVIRSEKERYVELVQQDMQAQLAGKAQARR